MGEGDFETTWLKLAHDAEMFEHLGKARLPPELRGAPRLYRAVLEAASAYRERPAQQFAVQLPDGPDRELWRATHNRNVYTPAAAERRQAALLNSSLDFDRIQEHYFATAANISSFAGCRGEQAGGWVVVDDLLQPDALEAVRAYLTESTFYYFSKFGGHYLSSLLEDGMSAPLLAQLAEELRARLPGIFGPHHLSTAWAFKFDNLLAAGSARAPGKQVGVGVHADSAAVNVNFWPIAPSSGSEGGLTLYKEGAPADMSFHEFNDPKYLKRIVARAEQEHIEYRTNRLVIFNSNLLHETGRLNFAPGYLRRRINLTLLFGKRCA